MFIHLLETTSGFKYNQELGTLIDVPKKVKTQFGNTGIKHFDKRYKRLSTIEDAAFEMMEKQGNKVGYAIYENSTLLAKYIKEDYKHLETEL